jgi:hypothetical protein
MPEALRRLRRAARVSATALVHFQRNRYSVPTRHVNAVLSLRAYPDALVLVADGIEVARHTRSFERDLTFYDWQHYIPLVQIKPGALRNGAPFKAMPEILQTRSGTCCATRAVTASWRRYWRPSRSIASKLCWWPQRSRWRPAVPALSTCSTCWHA